MPLLSHFAGRRVAFLSTRLLHLPLLATILGALLSGPVLLLAQVDTGSLAGTVTDATGAAIPDADLVLREEATGVTSRLKAGGDGSFNFSPLKLGTYTLTVSHEGFKQSVTEHLQITIQSRIEVEAASRDRRDQ